MKHFKHIDFEVVFNKGVKHYFIGLFLVLTLQALFVVFVADPYRNVEYTAVEANKEVYIVGEEGLFFRSFATVKRLVSLEWDDNLRCDPLNDEFEGGYFSQYTSDITNSQPAKWTGEGVWHYDGSIPIQDADCELRSTTFVIYKIFIFLEYKKPLDPILSTRTIKFRRK